MAYDCRTTDIGVAWQIEDRLESAGRAVEIGRRSSWGAVHLNTRDKSLQAGGCRLDEGRETYKRWPPLQAAGCFGPGPSSKIPVLQYFCLRLSRGSTRGAL